MKTFFLDYSRNAVTEALGRLKDVLLIPEWLDKSAGLPDIKRATFIFDDTESVSSAQQSASSFSSDEDNSDDDNDQDWVKARILAGPEVFLTDELMRQELRQPTSANICNSAKESCKEIANLRSCISHKELLIQHGSTRESSGFGSTLHFISSSQHVDEVESPQPSRKNSICPLEMISECTSPIEETNLSVTRLAKIVLRQVKVEICFSSYNSRTRGMVVSDV
jgi:hypothetical protein